MPSDNIRGLDQMFAMLDDGNYLPEILDRRDTLLRELKDFSAAFGTKAKGRLTLKIDFTTDKYGQVEMTATDEIKVPKQPPSKANLWITDDGKMSPSNPNQRRMGIRDIGGKREFHTDD